MNDRHMNPEELAGIGIRFKTEEEARAFAEIIQQELEFRIGESITSRVTEQQIEEFDRCIGAVDSIRWLEMYCPDYRSIVKAKMDELEQELIHFKSLIPGNLLR